MNTAAEAVRELTKNYPLEDGRIVLGLDGLRIGVRSNSAPLIERLGIYFAHTLDAGDADIEIIAIDRPAVDLNVEYIDWAREPGKSGRKDAYHNLDDGRLVLKVRTGMVFLQSEIRRIAVGPCLDNDNQVINFINAQYMNWLQHNGALICHASGLVIDDRCIGIAGFSGGGKSTLMLHLMERDAVHYLTNDRLFIQKDGDGILARGIPKLPRINPGTIVHNARLKTMLSNERRDELLALPQDDLWHLEEKYDVFVEDVYGDGKIQHRAPLSAFLVLNWQRDGDAPCRIAPVDLAHRPELLHHAIMKSPGPFYQFKDGTFFHDDMDLDPAPYLDVLDGITVFEATGRIDFDYAGDFCFAHMTARGGRA